MSTTKGAVAPAIRYRPIFGGPFGRSGEFVVATMACIERGLHAVRYLVVQPRTGAVLAMDTDKAAALSAARRLLKAASLLQGAEASNEPQMQQALLWLDEELPLVKPGARPKPIPRRRREVFERSGGQCFYCRAPLELPGPWHIEHQQPRALGGGNDLLNLVAACQPCNVGKSDRTALQFVVGRTQQQNSQ
jgi:HNH endonuclease